MQKVATLRQRALLELIGTFMFVFLGAGAAIALHIVAPSSPQLLAIAVANGLALGIAVTYTMNISGGHINPAVTIGMLVTKRIIPKDAAVYIVAQLAGAIIAGSLLLLLMPYAAGSAVNYGAPSIASSITIIQAIAIESVLTFFLVFTIFGAIVDQRAPKLGGFIVSAVIIADVLLGGPLTGAAMNPARAMGPMIASMNFSNWYVYWIGPIIGAIVAALIYEYCIMRK